jgi:cyclic beta-1,2-glucan synthetase
MAHHLGMSLIACDNTLRDQVMQRRFMSDARMASAEEFLQARISKDTVVYGRDRVSGISERPSSLRGGDENLPQIDSAMPRAMLLSNGELTEILTDTGAGLLRSAGADLTRHSEDLLRRAQGIFAFIKANGKLIPVTRSPLNASGVAYRVTGDAAGVTFWAEGGGIEASMRCILHATAPTAQRQLTVKNKSGKRQTVDVLFYLEPTMSAAGDYNAHPAFSKLFVTTSYDPVSRSVSFSRRRRNGGEEICLTAALLEKMDFAFELKKENLIRAPGGFDWVRDFDKLPFAGEMGTPDAVLALRARITLNAGAQGQFTLLLHRSKTVQEGVAGIISARHRAASRERGAPSPIAMDSAEGRIGLDLLAQLMFGRRGSEQREEAAMQNTQNQSALWPLAISGDLPIVALTLDKEADVEDFALYYRLQNRLRVCGVAFDICLLYSSLRRGELAELAYEAMGGEEREDGIGVRGGVFFVDTDSCREDTVNLIRASARNCPVDRSGERRQKPYRPMSVLPVQRPPMNRETGTRVQGGVFVGDRFYVDRRSPLPYTHVLANPGFGCLLSDSCLGYSWAVNSRENKLTPWYNDIATDNDGERLLLRVGGRCYDLTAGALCSFSSLDAEYEGRAGGICTLVEVRVASKGSVKYLDVTLSNTEDREVDIQCAYYIEPVLGVDRGPAMFIRPKREAEGLLFNNPYCLGVAGWALMSAGGEDFDATVDRTAFLGGDWTPRPLRPQSDPCAAVIVPRKLSPGQSHKLRFILAFAATEEAVRRLAALPFCPQEDFPNSLKIKTPDPHLDNLINDFVPHQMIRGRMWARCGFYQCGGAYGFRDQLQDACGALYYDPVLTRRQIYRACAVQFPEGDVLHWWHRLPASGGWIRGVRTRYSDDLLWLPYAVCAYVEHTGDQSILSVPIAYLEGPLLEEGEHERYIAPQRSGLREDVYRHCLRAIDRASRLGERGLPLMGCGDWNDSFNRVGACGQGESVWLALFFAHVLDRFSPLCGQLGDTDREQRLRALSIALKEAVDRECWEGGWYLRAFYDDGESMGGAGSEECRIDLLPQSFAAIAGLADAKRVNMALDRALGELVDEKRRVVSLFKPPFWHSRQNPGYVKAYPPGIRENGGQYTHAAVWLSVGLFEAGRAEEGYRILQMLSPADRCARPELARDYKLEPYYLAADIYTNPDAAGRGGWSLYTGAAAWYCRAALGWLLGMRIRENRLYLSPRIPAEWPGFSAEAVLKKTNLSIAVRRVGRPGLLCDGLPADSVALDGRAHRVELNL